MELNKTLALALHTAMWTDMQTELGDNPSSELRAKFKETWIKEHFPNEHVLYNCFLCDYAIPNGNGCKTCPIVWPEGLCSGSNFSYCTAPISDILALPVKNEKSTDRKAKHVADETEAVRAYYTYRVVEELLSKASGLPGSVCIEDHVKAIKEKAVDEYFKNTPGAKLATMDVDEEFKQYADEQKAPIFRALAEASGLSAGNESVKAHIYEISNKAESSGRKEKAEEIFKAMSVYSGVAEGNWSVYDHAMAIMRKASNEKELGYLREKLKDAVGALKLYQSMLSYESNLPSSAPVADHITQIREYAFSDGQDHERERIMDKIGEMLNDKSAREAKDS